MSSKRIEIYKKKPQITLKKPRKISLKCQAFLKKNLAFSKNKASWQLLHCHNGQFAPDLKIKDLV
jgi:hypothetical protein